MIDFDAMGLVLRQRYWTELGDPDRAASEPSAESREAWRQVAKKAYDMLMGS